MQKVKHKLTKEEVKHLVFMLHYDIIQPTQHIDLIVKHQIRKLKLQLIQKHENDAIKHTLSMDVIAASSFNLFFENYIESHDIYTTSLIRRIHAENDRFLINFKSSNLTRALDANLCIDK